MPRIDDFWRTIDDRCPGVDHVQCRMFTRSVLRHLRRHMGADDAQRFVGHLPRELAKMAEDPGVRAAERHGKRHVEEIGADAFYEIVARECHVPAAEAKAATQAVFHALKEALPVPEIRHVREQLPTSLAEAWRRA